MDIQHDHASSSSSTPRSDDDRAENAVGTPLNHAISSCQGESYTREEPQEEEEQATRTEQDRQQLDIFWKRREAALEAQWEAKKSEIAEKEAERSSDKKTR